MRRLRGEIPAAKPRAAPAPEPAGPQPLSFAQQRLWFLAQWDPDSYAYNVPDARRLVGELDLPALEKALDLILARHDVLRTVFTTVDERPVQIAKPHEPLRLVPVDLSPLPPEQREAEARRLVNEDVRRPFDLERGPPCRIQLLRLGPQEHVLMVTIHHICYDGWSTGILFGELREAYDAFRAGRTPALPPLPFQYGTYARRQRAELSGPRLEKELAHWREALRGLPVLDLPTDRPRPPTLSPAGDALAFALGPELSQRVRAFADANGATLYMTLLAAFQTLLSRYTGQDDVAVGSPIAGRTRAETEGLIGFFVNTLVLRGDLSGDPTFRELVGRTRERSLAAFSHQDVPFEKLVEELETHRDLSRTPLFQVVFIVQNASSARLDLPGLRVDPVPLDVGLSKFDLTLSMADVPGEGILAAFEYRSSLFDPETVSRMAGHFKTLLDALVSHPDRPISAADVLVPEERASLRRWEGAPGRAPEETAVALFEEQVARTPDAPAVRFEGRDLTYAELDARAERLARHLRAQGVAPGGLVGLCVERSPEMVVGMLGVMKAGGAYLPLDPSYPRERLAFMLEDSGAGFLVTQASLRGLLPGGAARVVEIEAALAGEPAAHAPTLPAGPADAAYVIYTSGSTGKPKGVVVEHRGVANLAKEQSRAFGVRAGGRVLQYASFSFDASVSEVLTTLVAGATLVLVRDARALVGVDLHRVLVEERITTVTLPPPVLRSLPEEDLPHLETLVTAGEACPPDLASAWSRRVRLLNAYGPTETTVCATIATIPPGHEGHPPIGRPLANTTVHVLDALGRPVPVGVPGELHVGGVGVARGYLGRPELTAEKFVADPFSQEPGARMYRTGDLVRWLPSGELEFLGRIDHQVKVRGFRIELGEIEAALASHPRVKDVAVVVREDAPGEKTLVACFVPGAEEPTAEDLRAHLRQTLPEHMVPQAFRALPQLPLSSNGKVDRKALQALAPTESRPAGELVAPRTPLEETLAAMWAEVLRVERVGVETSFFEMGGHSLLATQVTSRVRSALGVEIPLHALFAAPTVAGLARAVEAAKAAGASPSPAGPAARAASGRAPPMSFAQQRLWFLDQWEPGGFAYNIPEALRLRGALDARALNAALDEIVRRHAPLRTTFALAGGTPSQIVREPAPLRLAPEDVPGATPEAREEAARRIAAEEARRPFDLVHGPVFRARVLRLAEEEHLLLITFHHVCFDGWSMGVFTRELGALYAAAAQGLPSPLAPLPLSYADYAEWQRRTLVGETLERQVSYWRGRLAGVAPLELPTDRPRPAVQSHEGDFHAFTVDAAVAERLRAFAQQEGVTPYMALLAAFQALLSRYSGQEDVAVGSPIAGRTRAETEDLIGFFLNTLVLRGDLSGEPSFRTLLARTREACLGAYAHQDVPFEKLVEELAPERDLSRTPIFQVLFNLQNNPGGDLELPGLRISPGAPGARAAKFDLNLGMAQTPHGLAGVLTYATALFDAATIERMARHFVRLLEAALASPDAPLSRLPLLAPEEREEILVGWNRTRSPYPDDACVHELFAAQAARAPHAPAVACGSEELTYGELDRRANQLAHHLRALGVGPDVLVALCGERGIDLLVGMLGVLKAGGAYVPLDPSYPAERLSYILEETRAAVLLTQGHLAAGLPRHPRVVLLDGEWEGKGDPARDAAVDSGVTPDHLCYVIYTSGSTGKPKGVMVRHQGLTNYATWCAATPLLEEGAGTLVHSSLAFDLALTGLYPPLVAGRRVRLMPEAARPEDLAEALAAEPEALSFVKLTPSHLSLLAHQIRPEEVPGRVRAFVCGGEALTAEHLAFWSRADPSIRFLNHYGPTETVIGCCTHWVTPADLDGARPIPIGRPIANTRVYVLDRHLQPAPVGVRGELYVAGAGVARGYLNRPDLTAERFVPDPFVAGERMYRTGDLARMRADGEIEFLGRVDHQVKIRGYRVELGEVEATLREHPGVKDVAVVAREDAPGQKRLVAYVAPRAGPVPADALLEHAKRSLPEYMVPSAFVALPAIPLNANGKVDRKALPAPEAETRADDGTYAAPRTPVEEALAAIWAEILRLDRVGVQDNFFDLGGDSILSIQIITRAGQKGIRFTPKQLFQHQTIAELAPVVGTGEAVEAEQGPVTGSFPLTPIGHYFFNRDLPDRHYFNLSFMLEVPEDIQPRLVEETIGHILRHHDALRLAFAPTPEGWTQRILPPGEVPTPFRVVDLSDVPAEAQRARVDEESTRIQSSFDLASGRIVEVALFDLGAGRTKRLLFAIHHLAVDAVSWRVLFEDLESLYGQLARGEPAKLPRKTTSFKRWSEKLVAYAATPGLLDELPYWESEVKDAPSLPVDFPDGANTQDTIGRAEVTLDAEETRALLQEVPKAYRTQINDVLLTALTQAAGRWTGDPRLFVELEGHGREEVMDGVDLSRSVGWFTVLFPVQLRLDDPEDLGASLVAVKEKLRAIPDRGLGYGVLRHLAAPEVRARLAHDPVPPIRFNYLGVFDPGSSGSKLFRSNSDSRGYDQSRRGSRAQLVDVNGAVAGGQLRLGFTYSTNLYRPETIERFARDFEACLRALIAHCRDQRQRRITPSDFPLAKIDAGDLSKVLRVLGGGQ